MSKQVTLISNDRTQLERVLVPALSKKVLGFNPRSNFMPHVKNVLVNKLIRVEANRENLLKLQGQINKAPEGATIQDLQLLAHNVLQMVAYMKPEDYTSWDITSFLEESIDNALSLPSVDYNEEVDNRQLGEFLQALKLRDKLLLAHYYDLNEDLEKNIWPIPKH